MVPYYGTRYCFSTLACSLWVRMTAPHDRQHYSNSGCSHGNRNSMLDCCRPDHNIVLVHRSSLYVIVACSLDKSRRSFIGTRRRSNLLWCFCYWSSSSTATRGGAVASSYLHHDDDDDNINRVVLLVVDLALLLRLRLQRRRRVQGSMEVVFLMKWC